MAGSPSDALAGVSFDEQDRDLFKVDDVRLRADALRYSLLPKLLVVLNAAIRKIDQVYGVDTLADSGIHKSPSFREKRKGGLRIPYEWVLAGIRGAAQKGKWTHFTRTDGKEIKFLPFLYLFQLDADGLSIYFNPEWLTGLSHNSRKDIFDFHNAHEGIIHSLTYLSRLTPSYYYGKECEPISAPRDHYEFMLETQCYDTGFESVIPKPYPIPSEHLSRLVRRYAFFFPVYDSYLQIAMGRPPRIMELVGRLNAWIRAQDATEAQAAEQAHPDPKPGPDPALDLEQVRFAAAQRLPVMPSLRWQVFARDHWRCVACGRDGSMPGVILHVDHIVPRSRGGADGLDNYQTLCWECNLGKGNRDATDLRRRNNPRQRRDKA